MLVLRTLLWQTALAFGIRYSCVLDQLLALSRITRYHHTSCPGHLRSRTYSIWAHPAGYCFSTVWQCGHFHAADIQFCCGLEHPGLACNVCWSSHPGRGRPTERLTLLTATVACHVREFERQLPSHTADDAVFSGIATMRLRSLY